MLVKGGLKKKLNLLRWVRDVWSVHVTIFHFYDTSFEVKISATPDLVPPKQLAQTYSQTQLARL